MRCGAGARALAWTILTLLPGIALAALDLRAATREHLANGLELIVLEEHTLPVASVQMLYKAGARNEESGRTGLAHFLEHMAFRATQNFPGTEVVSAIYAVGGEWHGYTWIDQTTYYQTVPKEHLDLVLRIEADRMARLTILEDEVEAERGSVLAELHGYENDPATVLYDAVLATSFLAHPYRNNTIGWESDVQRIDRRDLVRFYRNHYRPANAVLVVVGDVDAGQVRARVAELFGDFPAAEPTPLPRSVEPPQLGERRVQLAGAGAASHFALAYRAPAANAVDFPAFLLMQELLGGASGMNFHQDLEGSPVRAATLLHGVVDDLETWLPPAAQPYVLTISGSVPADADPAAIEEALEARIAILREEPMSERRVQVARDRLTAELVFDVETPEDAAHQLAFYAGLDALDVFLALPDALAQTTAETVRDVASRYLQPHQRTVGWYRAGAVPEVPAPSPVAQVPPALSPPGEEESDESAPARGLAAPVLARLRNGIPAIVQRSALSPAAHVRVLVPSSSVQTTGAAVTGELSWGVTSIGARAMAPAVAEAVESVRGALDSAHADPASTAAAGSPDEQLELLFRELLGMKPVQGDTRVGPALVVAVGDFDLGQTLNLLDGAFGEMKPAPPPRSSRLRLTQKSAHLRVEQPLAQAQLGYVVPAPAPRDRDALAWQLLLYVFSHGYEGRLGEEAIAGRGLVYYIDAQYRSDGRRAFVSLATGVDPARLEAMETLLREQLAALQTSPVTAQELAEAKQHMLGRLRSAAASNEEISAALAQAWLWRGELPQESALRAALDGVQLEDLHAAVPRFIDGAVAIVSK